jgi:GntR family transcriptional regulator, transcriptional repressor for pyruvate dehydrogenase complex
MKPAGSEVDLGDVVTASAAKQIAENIRTAILQGKLKVDVRLPSEEELAARFSVSRPTIREALKRLAAQHLIRSRRGPLGGNFVTRPAIPEAGRSLANSTTLMVAVGDINVDEIVTAKLELESVCCRLACEQRTPEQLAAMKAEIELQRKSSLTDEQFCDSDVRFHRMIVDAGGNSLMKFLMHSVIEGLQPISNLIIFRLRERQEIVAFHKRIYSAIEARRKSQAVEALTELASYTRDRLAAAIERRA